MEEGGKKRQKQSEPTLSANRKLEAMKKWMVLLSKCSKAAQSNGQTSNQNRDESLPNEQNISDILLDTALHEERISEEEGEETQHPNDGSAFPKKKKKVYKTDTPRGPTRNLQLAKMRPGERKKVDFNVKGQPIGVNASPFANYCGTLVRDPLNAPLQVDDFAEIPQDNKLKMWDLVLEKFDLGLSDEEDEKGKRKQKKRRHWSCGH